MPFKHTNINFSIEKGNDSCLPFLYLKIFREFEKFATNFYRNKTLSKFYTNFKSFIPERYRIGLIKSLLIRCFSLCSRFIKFHHEVDELKSILHKNSYPRDLVDKFTKEYLSPITIVIKLPKNDLVIALQYFGKLSLQIRTRTHRILKNRFRYCNVRFVFQTKCKISNIFTFTKQNSIVLTFRNCLQIQIWWLHATYFSKTKRFKHLGTGALTGKRVKGNDDSAIKKHLLFCSHSPDFEDFSNITTNNNNLP